MADKLDQIKAERLKAHKDNEIKKLELINEQLKKDAERKAELKAQKEKIFSEKDMILMQQMQGQQKELHKLIQEFRESNADKLIEENQQLQDRLYKLEVDQKDYDKDDVGYYTMPAYESKFSIFQI